MRRQAVIYGGDDRVELLESGDPRAGRAASALLAVVDADRVTIDGSTIELDAPPVGAALGLCDDVRFAEQPTLARCSAALVAPDIALTAAHCVENARDCAANVFVAGWALGADGAAPSVASSEVYRCVEVLHSDIRGSRGMRLDFAFVRLDRPVAGGTPLPIRLDPSPLEIGAPLMLASFPWGLPAKVDATARVEDDRDGARDFFVLAADAFEGSSGGPLLDAAGAIAGVLVRGEGDVEPRGDCDTARVIDGPGAESATYAAWAVRALCAARPVDELCDGRDVCGRAPPSDACEAETCVECDALAPSEWTCVEATFAAADGCDCRCGAYDPDCDDPTTPVFGCAVGEACGTDAMCLALPDGGVTDEWSCNPARWLDGVCDCDCGAADPDCQPDACDDHTERRSGGRGCAVASAGDAGAWLGWAGLAALLVRSAARCGRRRLARRPR
ncbi:MAG: trypsin-like peptidase domain-containing protein [Myxococcales bacterium]|nr:trypsin-like peptidase domain-containing protein [Myxococcales bacterium]MCB9520276.1 trypsin-like peptidase domain-containing protein [Myxococcales bacterium]MCB9531356.1 trypsin-like peptidase domain-containing protein [Myxococcales bacterium]MCB9533571.1 trypsin-like peptidase domain-containing protein [Myxococcales bacterium]